MKLAKRILWFIAINIGVLLTISVSMTIIQMVFGINITGYGYDYQSVLIYAAIIGFSGAFISLFLSKFLAKSMYGITIIDSKNINSINPGLYSIYKLVESIAVQNKIKVPEFGVYDSAEPNAFATGWSKNHSLVAVSTGLLQSMSPEEIEGVIGHEMSHILNGDMVTMTLLQGVLNTFVVFLSRIIGTFIDKAVFRNEEDGPGIGYFISSIVLELLFSVAASVVLMAFSRYREYRADAGSAGIVGKQKMISALKRLQFISGKIEYQNDNMSSFKISGGGAIINLFSSHPPIEKRIENLQKMNV